MSVLRPDLLQGRAVALAPGVSVGIAEALADLGARVERLDDAGGPAEEQVGEWARAHRPLDVLVYDATASFGAGGLPSLMRMMQDAWNAVRGVALGALIESEHPSKVVLLGPLTGAGAHAEAARSALENLARTLSVEWARHRITVVMVAPGPGAGDQELAELVCFLSSPGGEYFSGARLELGRSVR